MVDGEASCNYGSPVTSHSSCTLLNSNWSGSCECCSCQHGNGWKCELHGQSCVLKWMCVRGNERMGYKSKKKKEYKASRLMKRSSNWRKNEDFIQCFVPAVRRSVELAFCVLQEYRLRWIILRLKQIEGPSGRAPSRKQAADKQPQTLFYHLCVPRGPSTEIQYHISRDLHTGVVGGDLDVVRVHQSECWFYMKLVNSSFIYFESPADFGLLPKGVQNETGE